MTGHDSSTSALIPQSPLFAPVTWNGRTYFTSQYFHRNYVAQSQHGGKYRQHSDFARVVRSIEAYNIYLNQGDIVEILWERIKWENGVEHISELFKKSGYNQLTLITDRCFKEISRHFPKTKNISTYVYLIQQENTRYFKIGISYNPTIRLISLQCGNPSTLTLVGNWRINKVKNFEDFLKEHLKNFHIRGEWFDLPIGYEKTIIDWAKTGYNLKWNHEHVRQALGAC